MMRRVLSLMVLMLTPALYDRAIFFFDNEGILQDVA